MPNIWIPKDLRSPLVEDYSDADGTVKPHGILIVDGKEVASTLMCPHCGGHFVARKGSGHRREMCRVCMGPCCDKPSCQPTFFHLSGRKPIAHHYGILSQREV